MDRPGEGAKWLQWAKDESTQEHQETLDFMEQEVCFPESPGNPVLLDGLFTDAQVEAVLVEMRK